MRPLIYVFTVHNVKIWKFRDSFNCYNRLNCSLLCDFPWLQTIWVRGVQAPRVRDKYRDVPTDRIIRPHVYHVPEWIWNFLRRTQTLQIGRPWEGTVKKQIALSYSGSPTTKKHRWKIFAHTTIMIHVLNHYWDK